jgi:glutamate-ammonia-ligase adenylyltransferase
LSEESSRKGPAQPAEVAAIAASIGFQDREGACRHLTRALPRVSTSLASVLPSLIADAPDPDSALLLFERLTSQSEALCEQLSRQPVLTHYAILLFGHSRFLGETLFREPGLLQGLVADRQLHRGFSRQDFHDSLARFRSRSPERNISLLLARFKKREYVRILLRDVLRIAPLAETTAEISALSDVLVDAALREAETTLERRYGAPQRMTRTGSVQPVAFSVLALGKLGGNELNYSSDIDLLYVHGDGESLAQSRVSNHEYFIRLAQHVTDLLSRVTEEGPVFRIDLRLRPQGRDGEVAVSLQQALRYYRQTAEDWERQALIKVRLAAGDAPLAREFIEGVQSVVYTHAINFAAIKTALVARERMVSHRARPLAEAAAIDVKLDHGGIRDIEFLVQCLQRVYGGSEPWLRSRGTLFALQKLHDKGHLRSGDFQELHTAYEFLRHVEHRLQLRYGQQTHRIPPASAEIEILRRSFEAYNASGERIVDVEREVSRRMASVSAIYKRRIFQQQARGEEGAAQEEFALRSAPAGVTDAPTQQILERLASDSPALYELATRRNLAAHTKRNLLGFLGSAFTGSGRYAALLRHPEAVEKSLVIFETSSYLTDVLIRHPEEIATLAEIAAVQPGTGSGFLFEAPLEPEGEAGDAVFAHLAQSLATVGERLALLRRHYRHRLLIEGARDLSGGRGVYNTLSATTAVADDAIAAACGVVGVPGGLAVLALGSLGSREFDVCSDADLLFVRETELDPDVATRAAERLIQALAAYTQDGTVFPVDTRLRPRGTEGELVLTVPQLESYFAREAQPWEALTYTKIRYVAGGRAVAERAVAQTNGLLARFARALDFAAALREMRRKLEGTGRADFKTVAGGLYDLDFLTGYLLIRHGRAQRTGTLRDRLWRCADSGLLPRPLAAELDHAGELIHSADHATRLVTGRPEPWLPTAEQARRMVAVVAGKTLGWDCANSLEAELARAHEIVRTAYERLLQ